MHPKSSQKNLGPNSLPIFLKNSRYLLEKQRFLANFCCFLAPFKQKSDGRTAGGGHIA